ncbi:hypothetical protein JYQ62_18410 [Nostoc sp. UHCC 0702]|nr:hypothetical protein JYQ62_18410 [Nostoc sp. UHCC 0702]
MISIIGNGDWGLGTTIALSPQNLKSKLGIGSRGESVVSCQLSVNCDLLDARHLRPAEELQHLKALEEAAAAGWLLSSALIGATDGVQAEKAAVYSWSVQFCEGREDWESVRVEGSEGE